VVQSGTFNEPSEAVLRSNLLSRGYSVLLVQPARLATFKEWFGRVNKLSWLRFPKWWVSTAELSLLCEVFRALVSTGEDEPRAVRMALEETPNHWLRKKLQIVLDNLQDGQKLSKAMSDYRCRRAFPPLMVETIRTGEENSHLEEALKRLADTFKRVADTKRETVSALVYPAFTVFVFVIVGILLAVLIPEALEKFAFADYGNDPAGVAKRAEFIKRLPLAIQVLFKCHDEPLYLIVPIGLIVGIVVLIQWLMTFRYTRWGLTAIQRKIPVVGKMVQYFALVRYLEVLTANDQSGMALPDSLPLVKKSVGDAIFEESADRIQEKVRTGFPLSAAMEEPREIRVYPGLVRQMVRAGERTGKMTEMLLPIIAFYNDQARASLKRMLDLITPTMIIVLGAMIGPVVIGVYQTIIIMQDEMMSGF
jgi:general secretion pathway protein F